MKINVYARVLLEQMWQEDKKLFAPDAENPPFCLRCGQPLHRRLVVNALSRHADAHICEDCGMPAIWCSLCKNGMPSKADGESKCHRMTALGME